MGLNVRALGSAVLAVAACGREPSPRGRLVEPSDEPVLDAGPANATTDAGPATDASADGESTPPDFDANFDAAPEADASVAPVVCELVDDFLVVPEEGRLLEAHAAAVGEGFAVVYAIREGDLDVLRLTLLDSCGAVTEESLPVDETGRYITGARAVGLPDGSFAVAWTRSDGDAIDDGVVFRRFDGDGHGRGAITTANQTEARQQVLHAAAPLPDGFALGWVDHSAADFGARPDAVLRSFDEDGDPLGDEELLSPIADGAQDLPVLSADGEGEMVAAYHVPSLSPQVRRRTAEGRWIDDEAIVLSDERKEVTDAAIQGAAYGFAIVSRAVEERGDVEVAVMDSETGAFDVISVAGTAGVDEVDARIAALPDGAFLLAWTDESHVEDESAEGVLAIRVLADGTLAGGRFVIPTETAGDQILQSLAAGAGGVLAVWIDYSHADGHDGSALRARLVVHEVVEVAQ